MTADEVKNKRSPRTDRCSVVILHESEEALEHAKSLCDQILSEMWKEVDMEIEQWPFSLLSDRAVSAEAASKAAMAEVVVVAAAGEGEFSPGFIDWTNRLVGLRDHHEGALVGLFAPGTGKEGGASSRDVQLHHVALRAGMDYLNHFPDRPHLSIPDLTEWCAARAETLTGTLDEIIRRDPPQ